MSLFDDKCHIIRSLFLVRDRIVWLGNTQPLDSILRLHKKEALISAKTNWNLYATFHCLELSRFLTSLFKKTHVFEIVFTGVRILWIEIIE